MIQKVQLLRFITAVCKQSPTTITDKLAFLLRLGVGSGLESGIGQARVQVSLNVTVRCNNGHGCKSGGCAGKRHLS